MKTAAAAAVVGHRLADWLDGGRAVTVVVGGRRRWVLRGTKNSLLLNE